MTTRQYRQYSMLVRVRNFGDAHKEQFAEGSEGVRAFATITAAVAQVDAFIKDQYSARRLSKKERLAAKLALASRIGALSRSARVMAKTVLGADARFPLPPRQSDVAVLQTGRLFLQEAEPVKDAFIACGLRATFLEDLREAVASFEQTISGRSDGKTAAVVAGKVLRSTLRKAVDAVQSLDVVVANAFGRDETIMAAWKKIRHVELAGPSAPVGAPSENGVSMPASPEAHPIPPAAGEAAEASGDQPAPATPGVEPLKRAS